MADVKGVWDPSGSLPCPNCGHKEYLLGFNYFNDAGDVMHAHYVCRYWASGKTGGEGRCGWHGWSVPGWDKEGPDQELVSDVQGLVDGALTWYHAKGQHNPEYGGNVVDAIADRVVLYIQHRDQERQ